MSVDLTPAQTSELRDELERKLARLQKSMKVTDEALRTVELDQTAVGRLSRMDSLQNQSLSKGLREREIVQLSQIREALQRMEHGTYGACSECGDAIPFERLFVFPEAPECAACVT
ncbi:MAG: TraR/DksA C4-type zinc finger protein [Gemmatimonadota bacterium]